jgi:hypothetical protein
MIWYLLICSMIGGLSVSVTTGLGSAIVTSFKGDNQVRTHVLRETDYQPYVCFTQFKYWFTYFLLGFVVVTLRKLTTSSSCVNLSQMLSSHGNILSQRCVGAV